MMSFNRKDDYSSLLAKVLAFDSNSDITVSSLQNDHKSMEWDVISDIGSVISLSSALGEDLVKKSYKSALLTTLEERSKGIGLEKDFALLEETDEANSYKTKPSIRIDTKEEHHNKTKADLTQHDINLNQKPFSDKLRQKHEKGGKRQGLNGHTGRTLGYIPCKRFQIGVESVAPKASASDNFGPKRGSQYVTAVEKHLGPKPSGWSPDVYRRLNHKKNWDDVPELLETETCSPPQSTVIRTQYNGFQKATVYQLKAKASENMESTAPHETDNNIYFAPARSSPSSKRFIPKKIFAIIDREIPIQVKDNELSWKLCNRKSYHSLSLMRRKVIPLVNGGAYWDVDIESSKNLDIDLGCSQIVTAFSMQGSPPPTRLYPDTRRGGLGGYHYGDCGDWYIEDMKVDEPYRGRYWHVFYPERKGWKGHQWVRSLRVFWRADGGRTWNLLGNFSGNIDTTTIKTHLLNGYVGNGGIRCRYLRFVPVTCENGGALRVQIYGRGMNKAVPLKRDQQRTLKHIGDGGQNEQTVEYRLYHESSHKQRDQQMMDVFTCGYGRGYYDDVGSKRRRDLKTQATGGLEEDNL